MAQKVFCYVCHKLISADTPLIQVAPGIWAQACPEHKAEDG